MQQNSKSCFVDYSITDIMSLLSYIILNIRGCLLVRQSFFHNDPKNFADVGGGVLGCRGFHSSFRTTQGGLSLNIGDTAFDLPLFLSCVVNVSTLNVMYAMDHNPPLLF